MRRTEIADLLLLPGGELVTGGMSSTVSSNTKAVCGTIPATFVAMPNAATRSSLAVNSEC